MPVPSTTPAPLVPMLPDLFNKRVRHSATTLQPGDSLHLTAPILGFARGRRLYLHGYCVHTDTQGQPYAATAYVLPDEVNEHTVTYATREASRWPASGQREQWFGGVLLYLVEIDLTEYADCLRLERLPAHLLPLLPAGTTPLPLAA